VQFAEAATMGDRTMPTIKINPTKNINRFMKIPPLFYTAAEVFIYNPEMSRQSN
jgi:hypothetical protein